MADDDSPAQPRWAEQELGELMTRAWSEPDAPSPELSGADAARALWEVDALPSEEEGGVAALFVPSGSAPAVPAAVSTPAWRPPEDFDGGGRAQLAEMLDRLPVDGPARLGPEDVSVEAPRVAPPAVWFWGDDDIYPGKVPGVQADPPAPAHRRRRSH